MEIPNYHLPSKILCIVMGVELKAKVDTDEIFTLLTLFPLPEQQEIILEDNHAIQSPSELYSFNKILTSTEISTLGRLYIPKEHAERCFPPLDMTLKPPMHDLVAKDLHGNEWNFRHIYSSYEKKHMLTNGWSTFVNSKNLAPGDSCIFVSGENGEFGIGIRRDMEQHSNICCTTSSRQSSQKMQLPPLVAAYHAISIGTLFHVQYYPW
ncbi:auxin response factor 2-like [Vicia villosa]|uniref:auxin response factor 2-like n=1 Tax=Vicia villosa TaxID=3911 RepID=UPI00273C55CF|nr:auxin response factor 2-like [Vicia villosa]